MKMKSVFNWTMRNGTSLALLLLALVAAYPAVAAERTVSVAVDDAGFKPAELEVAAGDRIRVEVTNGTASAIEFESFELNRERVVQPGQTVAVYVSGLSPGRYEFFDDFHKARRGSIVVK
jgi:plastocyanin